MCVLFLNSTEQINDFSGRTPQRLDRGRRPSLSTGSSLGQQPPGRVKPGELEFSHGPEIGSFLKDNDD